ncbi:MAG TPA: hypothetical protein VK616_09720, partial [Flavitalea sp.]|nr:hypothetical protein [Flavitalea sp.]
MKLKAFVIIAMTVVMSFIIHCSFAQTHNPASEPKIINIVNFIRDIEPRDSNITKDILYQTVVNQINLMK